ncbi:hypothetical protein BJ508DRAFT_308957 [Ascobolus immersus RN42]|uniref:Uncharacterized protein n=1 Tax=Ascobolus immersus RN42 TaxID=1160509 RepID=A0A3N4HY48_ASCIM|nr:hypothetical protein BJ508DRAFT_308957 [Ascobolus immersus RN42]
MPFTHAADAETALEPRYDLVFVCFKMPDWGRDNFGKSRRSALAHVISVYFLVALVNNSGPSFLALGSIHSSFLSSSAVRRNPFRPQSSLTTTTLENTSISHHHLDNPDFFSFTPKQARRYSAQVGELREQPQATSLQHIAYSPIFLSFFTDLIDTHLVIRHRSFLNRYNMPEPLCFAMDGAKVSRRRESPDRPSGATPASPETDWQIDARLARIFNKGPVIQKEKSIQCELGETLPLLHDSPQPMGTRSRGRSEQDGRRVSSQGHHRPQHSVDRTDHSKATPLSPPPASRPVPRHLNSHHSENIQVWLDPQPYENNHRPDRFGHPAHEPSDSSSEQESTSQKDVDAEVEYGQRDPSEEERYFTPDGRNSPIGSSFRTPFSQGSERVRSESPLRRRPTNAASSANGQRPESQQREPSRGRSFHRRASLAALRPAANSSSSGSKISSSGSTKTSSPQRMQHYQTPAVPRTSISSSSTSPVPLPDKAYQRESISQLRNEPPQQEYNQDMDDKTFAVGNFDVLRQFFTHHTDAFREELDSVKERLRKAEESSKQVRELSERLVELGREFRNRESSETRHIKKLQKEHQDERRERDTKISELQTQQSRLKNAFEADRQGLKALHLDFENQSQQLRTKWFKSDIAPRIQKLERDMQAIKDILDQYTPLIDNLSDNVQEVDARAEFQEQRIDAIEVTLDMLVHTQSDSLRRAGQQNKISETPSPDDKRSKKHSSLSDDQKSDCSTSPEYKKPASKSLQQRAGKGSDSEAGTRLLMSDHFRRLRHGDHKIVQVVKHCQSYHEDEEEDSDTLTPSACSTEQTPKPAKLGTEASQEMAYRLTPAYTHGNSHSLTDQVPEQNKGDERVLRLKREVERTDKQLASLRRREEERQRQRSYLENCLHTNPYGRPRGAVFHRDQIDHLDKDKAADAEKFLQVHQERHKYLEELDGLKEKLVTQDFSPHFEEAKDFVKELVRHNTEEEVELRRQEDEERKRQRIANNQHHLEEQKRLQEELERAMEERKRLRDEQRRKEEVEKQPGMFGRVVGIVTGVVYLIIVEVRMAWVEQQS